MSMRGHCLCGSVTYTASDVPRVGACHCGMCRRWSGGPLFAIEPENVEWVGETITTFESSDWAERGFCSRCGTALFYRLKQTGNYYVNPFTLEDPSALEFTMQVFIDEKPGFYDFAQATRNVTGAEIVAAFAGETEEPKP